MTNINIQRPLEKVFFTNTSTTTAGMVMREAFLPPQSILPIQYPDNSPISDVSHSINDYFSADVKDYHLLLERLNTIESLPDNWNGNGAEVFSADIIFKAKQFVSKIKSLSSTISIFPTARRSIQIEWEINDKYCEAEVFSHCVQIYAEKNGSQNSNNEFESIEKASAAYRNI